MSAAGPVAHEDPCGGRIAVPAYLVRHGEVQANLEARYAGRSAEPLTSRGREQAHEAARVLGRIEAGMVITSTVSRAEETASIIAADLKLPLLRDQRLDELRMGPWEGLREAEVAARFPVEYATWMSSPDALRLEGRETLAELAERVLGSVRDAVAGERPAILVTHVAPMRVAALRWLGKSLRYYKLLAVPNAAVIELSNGRARWLPGGEELHIRTGVNG